MNDNYMKTILSGVKEWTENLTDDAIDKANNAIDKANNALEQANKSIDKALYVVNATIDFDTFELSVDKTFEEIKQAYDEGKYSIVLSLMGASTAPLIGMSSGGCIFVSVTTTRRDIVSVSVSTVIITKDNVIETYSADLATTDSKLPNPYPLTFTGAVSETYDGSSAKTITIPSGGGGAFTASYTVAEEVTSYTLNIDTSKYSGYAIFIRNSTNKAPSITINREHKKIGFTGYDANTNFFDINIVHNNSDDLLQGCCRIQKKNNTSAAYYSYSHSGSASGTTEKNNGIIITAETIGAGSEIFVRCI